MGEKAHGSLEHLGVVGVGLEEVGGGGSMAEQRRRRGSSKSGELGPAWLGLKASLEIEEDATRFGRGYAVAEEARRRDAEHRR